MRHFRQDETWALGLYSNSTGALPKESFQHVHAALTEMFKAMGLAPTFFGYSDPAFRTRGKSTKWNGRTHRRIVSEGFENLAVVSIEATEPNSDAPAYDGFAYASFSNVKMGSIYETTLTLVVTNQRFSFGTPAFDQILLDAARSLPWEFGYALKRPGFRQVQSIVVGFGTAGLTTEEERQSAAWFNTDPSLKSLKLRDVFPYLILNEAQLQQPACKAGSLRDVLTSHREARLSEIPGAALFLWQGSNLAVSEVRTRLQNTGILI